MMHGAYNVKFHYHVRMSTSFVPALSQIKEVYASVPYVFNIYFNIAPSTRRSSSDLFPSGNPTKSE